MLPRVDSVIKHPQTEVLGKMAAQAKLMAALRKKDEEGDAPPPTLPPAVPTSDQGTLKLRKSNLLGAVSWEAALDKLDLNSKHDFAELAATATKMLNNILANPSDTKYRKIRSTNPNFVAKVWSCTGARELFELVGFKETIEDGFLILPEAADLSLLQRGLDALAERAAARAEADEKKRKLDLEKAAKARDERAKRAAQAAQPAAFDAAVASASSMVAEDEAMVEAIEAFMEANPELQAGRALDSYEIERQVAGPNGTVVASVVASAGVAYYDYLVTMRRSESGAWSVAKAVQA